MKVSLRIVVITFIAALIMGVVGIVTASHFMTPAFEKSTEGGAIMDLIIAITSMLFTVAVTLLGFWLQSVHEERETEKTTIRKMNRIVIEAGALWDTAEDLADNPAAPTRFIWPRSAWLASELHLSHHLHHPGLFYALERFYVAAEALREADRDRANFIWNGGDADTTPQMVAKHITNLNVAGKHLQSVLREVDLHLPHKAS